MTRALVATVLCAFVSSGAWGMSAKDTLKKASDHRHWRKYPESLKYCAQVLAHPEATDDQKVETYGIMIDVARRRRNDADVETITTRLLRAFPAHPKAQYYAFVHRADNHRDRGRLGLSMASYRDLAAAEGIDNDTRALAFGRMAELLLRMKRYPEALQEASRGARLEMRDDGRKAWALWLEMESAWRAARFEVCADAVERLLEPKYLRRRNSREYAGYYWRYAESKRLAKVYTADEARAYLAKKVAEVKDRALSQGLELRIARSFYDEGRYRDAVTAYERVFTEHANVTEYWYEAQRGIVESLLKMGRGGDAVSAARICLDDGEGGLARNTRLMSEVLRAADGNVERANRVIDFQRYGPRGPDGKPKTDDDLADPLKGVPYPKYGARARAFEKARAEAGDRAWSSYLRAMTYLYTGDPEEALRHFADCFRRCTFGDFQRLGEELVYRGLRPVLGHAWNIEAAYRYVAYGPQGKDGKTGTEDDCSDPFPAGIRAVPDTHTRAERAALERVCAFMKSVMVDGTYTGRERAEVTYSLHRVVEALGVGEEGVTPEWVLSRAARTGYDYSQEALLSLGFTVAKGDVLHFGKARSFAGAFDATLKEAGLSLSGRANNKRRHYWNMMSRIAGKRNVAPRERHIKPEYDRREAFGLPDIPVAPERRTPDETPPSAPSGLATRDVGYTWVEVSWKAAEDAESGVDLYEVFRDGARVARVRAEELSFRADGLGEGETHEYSVRALNTIGLYSKTSAAFRATTEVDTTAPSIVEVTGAGDKERLVVVFSEEVDATQAAEARRYALGPGVQVREAKLDDDGVSVALSTTALTDGQKYTISVSSIRDRAKTPNTAQNISKEFEFHDHGKGLRAVYFDEPEFKGKTHERIDPGIDFNFSRKDPAPGIARTDFTVRWSGKIRVDKTGTYTFIARTDDGVRLWVNKKRIVNAWVHRGASDSAGKIKLRAGKLYDIKMEYFQGGGDASAQLYWQSKTIKREIIPAKYLFAK